MVDPVGNTGGLWGGNGDTHFTVIKESQIDARVQNWIIGESLKGIIVAFSDQDWSIMWADMKLVNIQPDPVVTGRTPTCDTTPTWHWISGGGGDGQYRYRLDNGVWIKTRTTSFTPPTALPVGKHTLYVQESDAAGNWSMSGKKSIKIDLDPPAAPVVTGITPTTDTTPIWHWRSGGGGNGNYRYRLDGGNWIRTRARSFTPPTVLSPGPHTFCVQESDPAGNWSPSRRKNIVIDLP